MFWTIVGALLFVFLVIPIGLNILGAIFGAFSVLQEMGAQAEKIKKLADASSVNEAPKVAESRIETEQEVRGPRPIDDFKSAFNLILAASIFGILLFALLES